MANIIREHCRANPGASFNPLSSTHALGAGTFAFAFTELDFSAIEPAKHTDPVATAQIANLAALSIAMRLPSARLFAAALLR
jgi:hypothetical protein